MSSAALSGREVQPVRKDLAPLLLSPCPQGVLSQQGGCPGPGCRDSGAGGGALIARGAPGAPPVLSASSPGRKAPLRCPWVCKTNNWHPCGSTSGSPCLLTTPRPHRQVGEGPAMAAGAPSVGSRPSSLLPCPRPLSACDFWQPDRK